MIAQTRKNIMDLFIDGARRGFTIATTSLLPNVVMAFVIIQALKVTGLLDIVRVCEPIMALWGLPGAAATVLLASVMSMGGGVGVCASLVVAGTLSGHDATILLPAIYLMGSQVQYLGRILGVIGTRAKRIPLMIALSVVNAFLAMLLMRIIL